MRSKHKFSRDLSQSDAASCVTQEATNLDDTSGGSRICEKKGGGGAGIQIPRQA